MITLVRKSNDFRLYLLIVTAFLAVFLLGGCSSYSEENLTKEDMEPIATLPPLERILPNDPYLFLPLEAVGFQLTFTGEVDPATVEQSVSFEPKLDFTVRRTQPGEIYLEPEGKLQSETVYTLQVKGVKNEATGIPETLEFNYRTEFRGDRQITNPQWSHDGKEIVYIVLPKDSDTAELWKVNVDKGNEQLLAKGLSWPGRACWAPDDSSILFVKRVAQEDKNYSVPEVRLVDREGRGEKVLVFIKTWQAWLILAPITSIPGGLLTGKKSLCSWIWVA